MESADLDRAYRSTTYRAAGLALRIGDPAPALDALLAEHGAHEWAYLTAWNPRSVPLPRAENEARQAALRERLRAFPTIEGEASAADGTWREASVLVLGIPREEALAIARAFGQNAIVCGRRGAAPELVWC